MKKESLRFLACPWCHGSLDLRISKSEGEEVLEGILECRRCGSRYPVREGIPDLLPEHALGDKILRSYRRKTAYYDAYVSSYERNYHNPEIAYMRKVEDRYILSTRPRGLVLDIGCGTGRQSLMLAELGCQVFSLDISPGMLHETRRRALEKDLADRLELVRASAEMLPFREEIFHRAYSLFGALNHVLSLRRALREMNRVLRGGGTTLTTLLNRYQLTWWVHTIRKRRKNWLRRRLSSNLEPLVIRGRGKRRHKTWVKLFSYGEVRKMLEEAGFTNIRIGSLLILLEPRFRYDPRLELRGHEKLLAEMEERLRWLPPFDRLGAYLITMAHKI